LKRQRRNVATTYLMLPATPPSFASLFLWAGFIHWGTSRDTILPGTVIGVFKIKKRKCSASNKLNIQMSLILKYDTVMFEIARGQNPLSIYHPHRHFPIYTRFRKRLRLSRGTRCEYRHFHRLMLFKSAWG